jgi:hypothetical protein
MACLSTTCQQPDSPGVSSASLPAVVDIRPGYFTDVNPVRAPAVRAIRAFITIWGEGFGAVRGTSTVTIGGEVALLQHRAKITRWPAAWI